MPRHGTLRVAGLVLALSLCHTLEAQVSVLTQHNDDRRSGANLAETTLTPAVLTAGKFGKLKEILVDQPINGGPDKWASQIVAQPLVAAGVVWAGGTTKDVLIVCTMHGTVYVFDVGNDYQQLWAKWLGVPVKDLGADEGNIDDLKDVWKTNPEWGILSTPVIDPVLKRIYVAHWSGDNNGTHRLHAIDLLTGGDALPPVAIAGDVTKADGTKLTFNPVLQKQRPALLLLSGDDVPAARRAAFGGDAGSVYVCFGASIEAAQNPQQFPYYGWVFAYNAKDLTRRAVWCSTPNGIGAGLWQAGQGPAADAQGNIYLMTGNGTVGEADKNFGQSFVKLDGATLNLLSHFTPWNHAALNTGDNDLGSAGPVCVSLSGGTFIYGGGKEGKLYCLNPANLGGTGDAVKHTNPVVAEVQGSGDPPGMHNEHHHHGDHGFHHHIHGSPVFYAGSAGARLYLWAEQDVMRAFPLAANGAFGAPLFAQVIAPQGMPGGMLSVSANGATDGIVWAAVPLKGDANTTRLVDGVLRAFDATSLAQLWHSDRAADALGHFAKFSPPTIANGRVYVPTYDAKLVVYGVKP